MQLKTFTQLSDTALCSLCPHWQTEESTFRMIPLGTRWKELCCECAHAVCNLNYQKSNHSCSFQPVTWVFISKRLFGVFALVRSRPLEYQAQIRMSIVASCNEKYTNWYAGCHALNFEQTNKIWTSYISVNVHGKLQTYFSLLLTPSTVNQGKYGWFTRLSFMTTSSSNSLTRQM